MAEDELPPGLAISNAIRAQRESQLAADRENLKDTLVKSSLWKKNTLERIESLTSAGGTDEADGPPVALEDLKQSLLEIVEQHWQALMAQADAQSLEYLQEIEDLRQTIANLEAENVRLAAQRKDELDAQEFEISALQEAYDQFQRESDSLLNELEKENERLRSGNVGGESL